MKRLNKFLIALFVVGFATSCSDDYFDVNDSVNNPVSSTPALSLPVAQKFTVDVLQGNYNSMNTLGNLWAYSWAAGSNYAYFTDETNYVVTSSFRTRTFTTVYTRPLNNYEVIIKNTDVKYSNYVAIAKIMKAFHFQYLVDAYGDVPYSEALKGSANITPVYDNANDIYDNLIVLLTEAQDLIANPDATAITPSANQDIMLRGDMAMWAKFANTIKLRILLRQSEKAGLVSQADFDAAVNNGIGFLNAGEDVLCNPGYVNETNKQNPYWGAFGKTVAGDPASNAEATRATNYAISKLSVDPRRSRIFKPVGNTTNFAGIAQNDTFGPASASLSGIGPGILTGANQSGVIMLSAESLLLQAEAASKGYISGDAEALYNAGVQASFTYLGAGDATAYLASYAFPNNPAVNLEAIIYQKWVALMGINGFENWIEYRRTGFPADLPYAPNNLSGATSIPVRLLYPSSEYAANPDNVPAQTSGDAFTSKVFWQN